MRWTTVPSLRTLEMLRWRQDTAIVFIHFLSSVKVFLSNKTQFKVVDVGLLCRNANISDEHIACIFRLKMEAVCFSKTLVTTHKSTVRYTQKTNIDMFTAV
jgi:hypothetical protein